MLKVVSLQMLLLIVDYDKLQFSVTPDIASASLPEPHAALRVGVYLVKINLIILLPEMLLLI